jgi:hypothetical protein
MTETNNPQTDLVMVDHLSRDQLAEQLDDLGRLSTEDLRRELARSLRMTAESLVRLALIVRSLESRGEDLSGLKIGMLPYLRQIAYGQVLPEVVVRYAEQPMLVRAISALPFPDQEHLTTGGKVALAVRREDGTLDHRLVDPLHMNRHQVAQVFTRGRIRPPEEQIVRLESLPRPRQKTATESIDSIVIDRSRGGLVIGRRFYSAATMVEALTLLASPPESEPVSNEELSAAIQIRVTQSEHDRIRRAAIEANTKIYVMVRRALRIAGLI